MADQQFCLRWNNHQSTLISVFDTLLENGTLVDCTLAAEGQYLKAHKVVLSACSPYLETLLSQHYEKHPIVILKDVKFTELKSMMDYMYRGEVNISQDQLGTFLKAAESLQIKGLSDNAEGDARDVGSTPKGGAPPPKRTAQPAPPVQPQRPDSPANRDGSISPSSRKRRRIRRGSQGEDSNMGDSHLDANSCDLPSQAQSTPIVPNIPSSISTTIKTPIVKPEQTELVNRIDTSNLNSLPPESGLLKEKIEPISEPLLEPKTEYLDDSINDDNVEDLTLDDDDDMDMSNMSSVSNMSRPGPSHGNDVSQGFAPWQLGGNQSGTDEVFMAAQEAVNAHRDSQGSEKDGEEDGQSNTQPLEEPMKKSTQEENTSLASEKESRGNEDTSFSEVFEPANEPKATPDSAEADNTIGPFIVEITSSDLQNVDEVVVETNPDGNEQPSDEKKQAKPPDVYRSKVRKFLKRAHQRKEITIKKVNTKEIRNVPKPAVSKTQIKSGFTKPSVHKKAKSSNREDAFKSSFVEVEEIEKRDKIHSEENECEENNSSDSEEEYVNVLSESESESELEVLVKSWKRPSNPPQKPISPLKKKNKKAETSIKEISPTLPTVNENRAKNDDREIRGFKLVSNISPNTSKTAKQKQKLPDPNLESEGLTTSEVYEGKKQRKKKIKKEEDEPGVTGEYEYDKETEKFQCKKCEKYFKVKASILNHLRNICGKPPKYSCPFCPYKARSQVSIRVHVGKVHKVWPRLTEEKKWKF